MIEKPIIQSPYSHDPLKHLIMTKKEQEELYCHSKRADQLSRPYTVIDVLTMVYHRNFYDDLRMSLENDPSLFKTFNKTGEQWIITNFWINELKIIRPEAVFALRGNICPVDIALNVRIRIQGRLSSQSRMIEYYSFKTELRLRYIFDFTPCRLTCNYSGVILDKKMSILEQNPNAIRMNMYLLPVLVNSKDYEHLAQDIIKEDMPEYLDSMVSISGMDWLDHLHLKVYTGRFEDNGIMGEYFFGFGTAEVYDLEKDRYVTGFLNPGSVVLNVEACETDGMVSTTAAHEGTHHRTGWYYYMLQRCHGREISSYLCKKYGAVDQKTQEKWSPVNILELHANKLPGYILIQTKPGKQKAKEFMASYGQMKPLEKTKRLVDDMANHFGTTKTMAARRLYDFGYTNVNGIIQYIDGRKVPVYLSDLPSNKTYTINEKDAIKEYLSNPKFQKILDLGIFEYVEGHYCLRSSEYIARDQFGVKHLTYYAREHMSECCLVFEYKYDKGVVGLVGGVLHKGSGTTKTARYDTSSEKVLVTKRGMELRRQIEQEMAEERALRYTYNIMTVNLMKQKHMTIGKLSEETGLSTDTIEAMRNNHEKVFKIESVVAVCIALHLLPEVSREYIDKAPSKLIDTTNMGLYRYAINHWYEKSVAEVNRLLLECGSTPLTNLISEPNEEAYLGA